MNTKFFKYDMMNNTIIASATNIKKAGDPATPQYKELCAMKKAQPTFTVAVKEITKNKQKKTYKGLTMEAMETYISTLQDNARAIEEFNTLKAVASYPIVKSWFLSKYKETYTKKETKKAMTNGKIVRLTNKPSVPSLSKIG